MDIIEALDAAEIEWKPGKDESEIWICCPFCLEEGEATLDERFRLGINVATGKGHCFNCEKSFGGGDFLTKELQRVLDTGDMELNQTERKHKKKKKRGIRLPEDFTLLVHPSESDDEWNNKAWRYVRKRGISERQIYEKKIGYAMTGDFHHRVIFPVYYHGKLRGLVGRDFTDTQELKYKNSEGDKTIYNLPERMHHKTISLQEGPIDTLVVERASLKLGIDSGGLLGHSIQEHQLELLDHYKTIILWLDPDQAGIKGALSAVKLIPKNKIVKIILPNSFRNGNKDYDPSELETKEIEHRLLSAKQFTEEVQLKLRAWMAFED